MADAVLGVAAHHRGGGGREGDGGPVRVRRVDVVLDLGGGAPFVRLDLPCVVLRRLPGLGRREETGGGDSLRGRLPRRLQHAGGGGLPSALGRALRGRDADLPGESDVRRVGLHLAPECDGGVGGDEPVAVSGPLAVGGVCAEESANLPHLCYIGLFTFTSTNKSQHSNSRRIIRYKYCLTSDRTHETNYMCNSRKKAHQSLNQTNTTNKTYNK